MIRPKYIKIKTCNFSAISGIKGNKISYNNSIHNNVNEVYFSLNSNRSSKEFIPLYFVADKFPNNTYTELVSRRKFVPKRVREGYHILVSVDGNCATDRFCDLRYSHGIEDFKEVVSFFETLKKNGLYETYIKIVNKIFVFVDECKVNVLNDRGRVEDTVDIDGYAAGIGHDATRILNAKKESKGKK